MSKRRWSLVLSLVAAAMLLAALPASGNGAQGQFPARQGDTGLAWCGSGGNNAFPQQCNYSGYYFGLTNMYQGIKARITAPAINDTCQALQGQPYSCTYNPEIGIWNNWHRFIKLGMVYHVWCEFDNNNGTCTAHSTIAIQWEIRCGGCYSDTFGWHFVNTTPYVAGHTYYMYFYEDLAHPINITFGVTDEQSGAHTQWSQPSDFPSEDMFFNRTDVMLGAVSERGVQTDTAATNCWLFVPPGDTVWGAPANLPHSTGVNAYTPWYNIQLLNQNTVWVGGHSLQPHALTMLSDTGGPAVVQNAPGAFFTTDGFYDYFQNPGDVTPCWDNY